MTVLQLSAMLAHLPAEVMGLPIEMHVGEGWDVPIWEVHVIPPDNKAERTPRVLLRFNPTLDAKRCPLVITEARKGC